MEKSIRILKLLQGERKISAMCVVYTDGRNNSECHDKLGI